MPGRSQLHHPCDAIATRLEVLEGLALAEHVECHELPDLDAQSRIRILEAQVEVLSTFTSRAKKIEELQREIHLLKNNGK
jgi:hypothetical protein